MHQPRPPRQMPRRPLPNRAGRYRGTSRARVGKEADARDPHEAREARAAAASLQMHFLEVLQKPLAFGMKRRYG